MAKNFFKRRITRVAILLLACFVLIQFFRPPLGNPPVTGDLQAPPEVKSILQRACYDCHSNETKLAWFDKPAPAIWLVTTHVKEGRELLNFSHWDSLSVDQQKGKLFESLNQIVFKEMPLSQYTTFHGDARVSDGDIRILRKYLASLAPPKLADSAAVQSADEQYAKWIAATGAGPDVKPEPNGFAYLSDFSSWQAISSTERWDNGTMRVIMGNPAAVKAIREGRTNPWPDGTAFAKVAWKALLRPSGEIMPGQFLQVEFMLKDKEKYATTGGWGWGRWKGDELKPYGKDASFVSECMHCHQPMHDRDLVFTMPVEVRDEKVITSRIDKSKGTMSTLYGNDIAVAAARKGIAYPAHSVLTLVTWRQKEDEHWYGANIPASIQSVETVKYGIDPEDRWKYMTGLRASVMP
ncbi:MAG: heme-binding domain-containing protein [Chitinophagaceae bacterium]|nr:heme-binding domain-containing protein [Chitinophagaceae bacterium]